MAASVLQSSSPSNADSSGRGRNESPMNQQISEVQNIDRGMQNVDKYDVSKLPFSHKLLSYTNVLTFFKFYIIMVFCCYLGDQGKSA